MKKTIIAIAAAFAAISCLPDDRNNFMVPDRFGITGEVVKEASVHTGSLTLGISKSGIGQSAASVEISIGAECAQYIADYNTANGTSYKAVDNSLVTLDNSSLSFAVEDVVKTITLTWNPAGMTQFIGDDKDYVIPILLKADKELLNEGHSFLMVHLNRSGVSVVQTRQARIVEAKDVEADAEGKQPELTETITLDITINPAIDALGLSMPVVIDNSLVAEFNSTQETPFAAAPEGLITIVDNNVSIAEGGVGSSFRVVFNKDKLMSGGKLLAFPDYVVPIRVKSEGLTATYKGEEFNLQGLSFGNTVTYFTVSYYEPPKGFSCRRIWGKYSTSAGAWSSYIPGFTAGADRNVTLDDNYIYIAETNTTKNLWAISIVDGESYKKLPVGTVTESGTFYLSCPRVVKNTNPDINGGKDVLMVSNMTEGNPKMYVYNNGIDADPSVIAMETWAGRRLGDTFTWWGSLQNGILFFKDFNSTDGTVTFKMANKVTGTMYLIGRIKAPQQTGAGAYYPFPDDINSGISSVRGGSTAWYTSTTKDLLTLEGADNAPTLEELSGYYADSEFKYFELGSKRYVAYTRQVSPVDGRLIILEGNKTDSWKSIITTRNVVYHAAIQNGTENEGLDETESPMASGNSGMDLDIRENGTSVYIAVIKQNVGLSLFQVTNEE